MGNAYAGGGHDYPIYFVDRLPRMEIMLLQPSPVCRIDYIFSMFSVKHLIMLAVEVYRK